jgi:hypothetical protein
MADDEVNRALAESYIARNLGFRLSALQDRATPLPQVKLPGLHFKRYKNQVDDKVRASALVAQRVAAVVVKAVGERVPGFKGHMTAQEVRASILREHRYVDLRSLLEFCWRVGIITLQLAQLPTGGKRFDGMAALVDGRPVIVLASGRDGAPWLAFYLAHELGHVMRGHLGSGTASLVDMTIASKAGTSGPERAADRFACEVLTGDASPTIPNLKKNALELAITAERSGPKLGIDPGVFALIYAKSNDRWAVAQNALKDLDLDKGGRDLVAEELSRRLVDTDLVEADERVLGIMRSA